MGIYINPPSQTTAGQATGMSMNDHYKYTKQEIKAWSKHIRMAEGLEKECTIQEQHCHDKNDICMPFIKDCVEHWEKCWNRCHDECVCARPNKE